MAQRLFPALLLCSLVSQAEPLKLPTTLPSTSGYVIENALPGLTFKQPLAIASVPGEKDRLFIAEKGGQIHVVTGYPAKPVKALFLDVEQMLIAKGVGTLATDGEWGVLGLAFHPRFAETGFVFVTYAMKVKEGGKTLGFNCLSRFTVSKSNPNQADPSSELRLLAQLDPAAYHNGGDLQFGPDGYLYYSMGDGGGHYDTYDNARRIDKDFFAAIYRLDVDAKPESQSPNPHVQASTTFPSAVQPNGYKVPSDNPFNHKSSHNGKTLDPSTIRTEVFASGFRNPWRISFDSLRGDLYAGVVGEDRWEQVYQVSPGSNAGWSYYEGSHEGPRLKDKPADATFIKPIYEYPHGNDTIFSGNSVTGGVISRSRNLDELDGVYIFGDYISHCVWALRKNGEKWTPQFLARGGAVSAFGVDPTNGDTLLADFDSGRIQKLARAPKTQAPPPKRLSETGAFTDVSKLEPSPGVIPYVVNHSAWNDGAVSRRWFSLRGKEKFGFNEANLWTFPTGTVWIQQLDEPGADGKPGKHLETRFLVKTDTAAYGITYKWLPDQSDAELVPEDGLPAGPDDKGRATPGRAACLMCHTAVAGYTLGMNTWQLNRPSLTDPATNQLKALITSGHLDANPVLLEGAPAFAALGDTTRTLEDRCRSYLAVNCSHCHQQDGVASSPWSTKADFTTSRTRMVNGELNNDFGDKANRVIAPGDPEHSMILKRLKGDGVPRMPMNSTGPIDQAGIDFLTEWIKAGAATGK